MDSSDERPVFEAIYKGEVAPAAFVLVIVSGFMIAISIVMPPVWPCALAVAVWLAVLPLVRAWQTRNTVLAYFRAWPDRFEWKQRDGTAKVLERAAIQEVIVYSGFEYDQLVFKLVTGPDVTLHIRDMGITLEPICEHLYGHFEGVVFDAKNRKRPAGTLAERTKDAPPPKQAG